MTTVSKPKITIDYKKISNVRMANVHSWDYPDLTDAFIEEADYDGEPMSEEMLDVLNDDYDFVHENALEKLR